MPQGFPGQCRLARPTAAGGTVRGRVGRGLASCPNPAQVSRGPVTQRQVVGGREGQELAGETFQLVQQLRAINIVQFSDVIAGACCDGRSQPCRYDRGRGVGRCQL